VVRRSADYVDLISDKKIRAAVDIPPGFQAGITRGDHPEVKIYIFKDDLKSMLGASRIEKLFTEYRDAMVRGRLASENLPESLMKPFDIDQQNVVSDEKVAGESYGGLITYLVILMCMTGAMYPAMDLTAGEKERGTMETILSSPIERTHLVFGKFLVVLTASLATATLSVISMGGSFAILSRFARDPVSYTHLDVYKRQTLSRSLELMRTLTLMFGSSSSLTLFTVHSSSPTLRAPRATTCLGMVSVLPSHTRFGKASQVIFTGSSGSRAPSSGSSIKARTRTWRKLAISASKSPTFT